MVRVLSVKKPVVILEVWSFCHLQRNRCFKVHVEYRFLLHKVQTVCIRTYNQRALSSQLQWDSFQVRIGCSCQDQMSNLEITSNHYRWHEKEYKQGFECLVLMKPQILVVCKWWNTEKINIGFKSSNHDYIIYNYIHNENCNKCGPHCKQLSICMFIMILWIPVFCTTPLRKDTVTTPGTKMYSVTKGEYKSHWNLVRGR